MPHDPSTSATGERPAPHGAVPPRDAVTTMHLVKSEDLNHHQTLYAGRCVEWCVQAAYITAESCFATPQPLVFISIRHLAMRSPARIGDMLRCTGRVDHVGDSTIGVRLVVETVQPKDAPRIVTSGTFLFCTVDESGRAVQHNLFMPPAANGRPQGESSPETALEP